MGSIDRPWDLSLGKLAAALGVVATAGLVGCPSGSSGGKADEGGPKPKPAAKAASTAASAPKAGAEAAPKSPAAAGDLVVLSGRKEALVGPLLAAFEADTKKAGGPGVKLAVDYGKTAALAMRLVAEGERSGGDVVLAQEVGYLGSLGKAGLLAPVPAEVSAQVGEAFRDPQAQWVGVSGRLRVLVRGGKRGEAADATMPKTLKELADPRFKGKLGWAPGNASMHAHVSVLRHLWGEAETETWLKGMMANEAKSYPKNSPQVRAAADGAIDIGWVNHYYLHKLGLTEKAANYSFPTAADAGNVMMVSGAAVLKSARNPAAAWKLINHLLAPATQKRIAKELYEYPAREGVAAHPDVPPLEGVDLAKFDARHLADVGPTVAMLRKLGLQ